MLKNKKWILFCSLVLLILSWQLYQNKETQICVHRSKHPDFIFKIPLKDKKKLEYFFKYAIIRDDGGYTLFNNKPMWMGSYLLPFTTTKWKFFLSSISPPNLRKYFSWKTWQKYQHMFGCSNFLMWEEENPFWTKPNPAISILLINKSLLSETINKYIKDFQAVLQRDNVSCEELLNEAKNKPFLKTVLHMHNGLIGTLFGYGRDNSWLFEERKNGKNVLLTPIWDEKVELFFQNVPRTSWWWFGSYPKKLSNYLDYPTFLADANSDETKELKTKFLETRERILSYYEGKNFLEATLSMLLEEIDTKN